MKKFLFVFLMSICLMWGLRAEPVWAQELLPVSYMTDFQEVTTLYPATRDQGLYGTCWAFSAVTLAELDLIRDGIVDASIDLSELQLVYYTYHEAYDPLGCMMGDYAGIISARADFLDFGGDPFSVARRMSQWIGPVFEEKVPYSMAEEVRIQGVAPEYAFDCAAHLQNVETYRIQEDALAVKAAIMRHGAVATSIYSNDFASYGTTVSPYDGATILHTYNTIMPAMTDHAVTLIGWDDNFPAEAFVNRPAGNGAWLVRNSWSFESQNSMYSYFWLSYYDVNLKEEAYSFDMEPVSNYDNNYQHDGGILVGNSGLNDAANVFVVPARDGIVGELLTAVSVEISQSRNVSYCIDIYTNVDISGGPTNGVYQEAARTSGVFAYPGIHTVTLASPVVLSPQTVFSIVVSTEGSPDDPEYGGIDCEFSYRDADYDIRVSRTPQTSYAYWGDVWQDITTWNTWTEAGNFCIKGFTKNVTDAVSIAQAEITLSKQEYTYNGKAWKPSVTVMLGGYPLVKDVDYTVSYLHNTEPGTALVCVEGIGCFTGMLQKEYRIKLPAPSLSKVSGITKGVKVTWKQAKGASGYEISYSTKSNFSDRKNIRIKDAKTVSRNIKNLVKGKTYYVRIRSYRTDDKTGETIYSAWSTVKKVKVTK